MKDQLLSFWESRCCFPCAAFNICSLCLIFVNLINVCLGVFCLGFILFGMLWVFNYYLLKHFLMVFLFVFFFWDSYDWNVGSFNIVTEISEVVLISFNSFFFCSLCLIYFYHSVFYLTYPIFCLHYSTVGPPPPQSVLDLICCIIRYILTLFYFF